VIPRAPADDDAGAARVGTGIPTSPNVHEIAQSIASDSRVRPGCVDMNR
jgi:hypothetical protein